MHRPLQETSVPSPRSQQGLNLVNLPSLSKGTITFPLNTVFSLSLHHHPNIVMRTHTSTHNACTESLTYSCITHNHKPPPLERPLQLFIPALLPLTSNWRPVHDLILGKRLALIICIGPGACGLSSPNLQLHVLDLDAHKKEVDLAYHNVFHVVPACNIHVVNG